MTPPPVSVGFEALCERMPFIKSFPPEGTIAQIEGAGGVYRPKTEVFSSEIRLADGPSKLNDHAHAVARRLHGAGAMANAAAVVDQHALQSWLVQWLGASIVATARPRWHTEAPIVACCAFATDGMNQPFREAVWARLAWAAAVDRVTVVTGTPPVKFPGRTVPSGCKEAIVGGSAGQVHADFIVPGVGASSYVTPVVAGGVYIMRRLAGLLPATRDEPAARFPEVIKACMLAGRREDIVLDIDAAVSVLEAGRSGDGEFVQARGWAWSEKTDAPFRLTLPTGAGRLFLSVAWTRPVTELPGADGKFRVVVHDTVVWLSIDGDPVVLHRSDAVTRSLAAGAHRIEVMATGPCAIAWRFVPEATLGEAIGEMLNAWGSSDPAHDLNGDGIVDGADLGILLRDGQ